MEITWVVDLEHPSAEIRFKIFLCEKNVVKEFSAPVACSAQNKASQRHLISPSQV